MNFTTQLLRHLNKKKGDRVDIYPFLDNYLSTKHTREDQALVLNTINFNKADGLILITTHVEIRSNGGRPPFKPYPEIISASITDKGRDYLRKNNLFWATITNVAIGVLNAGLLAWQLYLIAHPSQ